MEQEPHMPNIPDADIYTDLGEGTVGANFRDADGNQKNYRVVYRTDNPDGPNGIVAAMAKVVRFLENLGGKK